MADDPKPTGSTPASGLDAAKQFVNGGGDPSTVGLNKAKEFADSKGGIKGTIGSIGASAASGASGGTKASAAVGGGLQGAVVAGAMTAFNKNNRRRTLPMLALALLPTLIVPTVILAILLNMLMPSGQSERSGSQGQAADAAFHSGLTSDDFNVSTQAANDHGLPWQIMGAIKTFENTCQNSDSSSDSSSSASPSSSSSSSGKSSPSSSSSSSGKSSPSSSSTSGKSSPSSSSTSSTASSTASPTATKASYVKPVATASSTALLAAFHMSPSSSPSTETFDPSSKSSSPSSSSGSSTPSGSSSDKSSSSSGKSSSSTSSSSSSSTDSSGSSTDSSGGSGGCTGAGGDDSSSSTSDDTSSGTVDGSSNVPAPSDKSKFPDPLDDGGGKSVSSPSCPSGTKPVQYPDDTGKYHLGHIKPKTLNVGYYIGQKFGLTEEYGWRDVSSEVYEPDGHPAGNSVDLVVNYGTSADKAKGDAIANFLLSMKNTWQIREIMWWHKIWTPQTNSWVTFADRGNPSANHMNHVHLSLVGQGASINASGIACNTGKTNADGTKLNVAGADKAADSTAGVASDSSGGSSSSSDSDEKYLPPWNIPEKSVPKKDDQKALSGHNMESAEWVADHLSKSMASSQNRDMSTDETVDPNDSSKRYVDDSKGDAAKVKSDWVNAMVALHLEGLDATSAPQVYDAALQWFLGNQAPLVQPSSSSSDSSGGTITCTPDGKSGSTSGSVAGFSGKQLSNAAIIIKTVESVHAPQQAAIVAVATAMGESTLQVLAATSVPESMSLPHDGLDPEGGNSSGSYHAIGLFQQRHESGWGSVQQEMDPTESTKMYLGEDQAASKAPGLKQKTNNYQNFGSDLGALIDRVQVAATPGEAKYGQIVAMYNQQVDKAKQVYEAVKGYKCTTTGGNSGGGGGNGSKATCADPGYNGGFGDPGNIPEGQVYYKGSCWLGGKGVDVMSNGSHWTTTKWQCVELPVRLWHTKGWAPASWRGANGKDVWDSGPVPGATQEPQGKISKLSAGDILSMTSISPYGHVDVVNSVTKNGDHYDVETINQNTDKAIYMFTWDGKGTVSYKNSGFTVTGVMHHN